MCDIASKFYKAKKSYAKAAIAQAKMRQRLCELVLKHSKSYDLVFEFGAGQDELGLALRPQIEFKKYIISDINEIKSDKAGVCFKKIDMRLPLPKEIKGLDLAISNACLQWLDAKSVLESLSKALKPNALLALSTFGKQNLRQIKALSGIGLNYLAQDELAGICQKHYKDVRVSTRTYSLKFDSALDVFRHLKLSGVNSLGRFYISKEILNRCEKEFNNTISYEAIFLTALKR